MIRHIIMFKFQEVKDDDERLEKAERMRTSFGPLRNVINVVESYEVVFNQKKTDFSYDVAIISDFISWENLETYIKHPEHQQAILACKDIKKEKAVIDYQY